MFYGSETSNPHDLVEQFISHFVNVVDLLDIPRILNKTCNNNKPLFRTQNKAKSFMLFASAN